MTKRLGIVAAVIVAVAFGGGPEPSAASTPDRLDGGVPSPLGLAASSRSHTWSSAAASYYLPTGNRTSCGKAMTMQSWHVASLKPDTAKCGLRLLLCHRTRCVLVRVQDRGAWRGDHRRWDLTPRVKHALRCHDLCNVRWKVDA